jgi:hypothetical protein
MNSLARAALAFAALSLSACCTLNAGIDGREEFLRNRQAAIGKTLDISSTHPAMVKTRQADASATIYLIGQEGYCQFEYEVSSSSRVVKSWRYVSEPAKCTADRYYCGAW